MNRPTAAVVGQLARDLVLTVPALPDGHAAADATGRRELLGGKGANQAVALAQLGVRPALVAVAGDDRTGDDLLAQARRDGIDTAAVVRRAGTPTGLIVELLEDDATWRYVQHLPDAVLLTPDDVVRAAPVLRRSDAVLVQLQQPADAALAAAEIAAGAGRLVVLDGAPPEDARDRLIAAATVVRADEQETRLLLGDTGDTDDDVLAAATSLLDRGPGLLALGRPGGNLFVWRGGHLMLPTDDDGVRDTTGGGDAFTAALTAALLRGDRPADAARHAVAASGSTVRHPGGRPGLAPLETGHRGN
ncbi:PfkB family carbohydrate kinase [Spirilliplanes yamanashiensis]|uniref:Ribokinase n=1 Tax=Spirilliplanes yamanashiensis TaxID=42233 RepID=A0A8J3Y4Q5_9ACTN|nr:PfkB family carbohydrate kinase [Spirilliplanes yamanashiensis]MDP9819452.1 ribokinase [Spirilliplanes yamanashiensis]GIJ01726.1 ribokinase [Spirilliplanes yamanashiensis]